MNDDGFCRVLVRDIIELKDSCGILYVKDVTEAFSKIVRFYGKGSILFLPGRGNAFLRAAFPT